MRKGTKDVRQRWEKGTEEWVRGDKREKAQKIHFKEQKVMI